MTCSRQKTKCHTALLVAAFIAISFPTIRVANGQTLGDDPQLHPRYTALHNQLVGDGMVPGQGAAYYAELRGRIEAAQVAGDDDLVTKLTAFRRDCESLPHCIKRPLYVLMFSGRGTTIPKANEEQQPRSEAVHPDYKTLRASIHDEYGGAMFQGFWDYFFATRDQDGKNPEEAWPVWSLSNPFTLGTAQVRAYLDLIPADARVIIVGYSLGGTTALHMANAFRYSREIEALVLIDFVGMYGWRWNTVKSFWIPPNVHNFYNRWQTRGCFPGDFWVSAELAIENTEVTKSRQEEALLPSKVRGGECGSINAQGSSTGGSTEAHGAVLEYPISLQEIILNMVRGKF